MRMQRRQLWLILAVQTVFFGVLAAWVLVRLERVFEPLSVIVALAIVVIGDVATVLLMQMFAPTGITFAAGESRLTGQALDGFGRSDRGHVLVRGERWSAQCQGTQSISPGDSVRIVSRKGLLLTVERI